ncbi:acyltransferase [Pseudomonas sp. AM8]|uniref:acyltransferase n=1 Tax=Pseudomonas sp. AM8 TaxID=2983368 RepID=UPI002E7FD4CD|nr:acyltransferase [Pseudomonas sp. AM8]
MSSSDIGENTRIWQYCVVLDGAKIGKNCNLCAHTLVEGGVIVGDNVTLKSGVYLWEGTLIEDNVFIGPNATFTNDLMPRSRVRPEKFKGITIKFGASIGANATLLPGISIGRMAMVGAGAVVTKDVPDFAVVVGNPAKIIRYIG